MDLQTPIKALTRVGAATASKLKRLNIVTAGDLLWYLPVRYDDFSQTAKIDDLQLGAKVNIRGEIQLINNKKTPRARMNITEALVGDETGMIRVVWFNQPFITQSLHVGDQISLAGKIEEDYAGLVMKSPIYEKLYSSDALHTQGLVPVYSLTAELSAKQLRFLVSQVIRLADTLIDPIPVDIRVDHNLIDISRALRDIHFPKTITEVNNAKRRLAFDELFFLQLQSQLSRLELKTQKSFPIEFNQEATKSLVANLPFDLTVDQKKSAWEIIQALNSDKPMIRLLEGDVGTGKTVVALLAMLNVACSGQQSALMAPTEILASQHYDSLVKLTKDIGLKIALLTRTMARLNTVDKLSKPKLLKIIAQGDSDIVVGTHALIQEKVAFDKLALVVIDEQHRFGVEQRQSLVNKNLANKLTPHLLSMTATPIPRSLALALYDDLDISIIKTKPKDRPTIITRIVDDRDRAKAYDFIRAQIKSGRQAFIICPLIDPSDALGFRSVSEEHERLSKTVFRELKVGLLHGKLKAKDKDELMKSFSEGQIDILVATSVIEVGIDVPNASIMMIENADRFGLAQLHQYRGRVGRGLHQSYCLLFTDSIEPRAKDRLNALLKFDNGFDLAKEDLRFRGPGEVYGKMQSGFPELKVASLFDYDLMAEAKAEASKLIAQDPSLTLYPVLQARLKKSKSAHLE